MHPSIENLNGHERLRKHSLQSVVPARPAIQNATLDQQRIEQHGYRRRPRGKADAVNPPELVTRSCQEVRGLLARIALLGREPPRDWLAVIMVDDASQCTNFTIDRHAVTMPLLAVDGLVPAIEHDARGIKRATQRLAMDAVHEGHAISGHFLRRDETLHLHEQCLAELVIRIERKHPRGAHLSEPEIALIGKIDEWMRDHRGLRIRADDRKRLIAAAAVDDNDPLGPGELVERAAILAASL